MNYFDLGTVVKQKSGGPAMTVCRYTGIDACFCRWFQKDEQGQWEGPFEEMFLFSQLEETEKRND